MNLVNFLQNQAFAYVIYSICAVLMLLMLSYTVAKLFFLGTLKDRLDFLKSYKKGPFLIIYIIAIPLYFFGYVNMADFTRDPAHPGTLVLQCFLSTFKGVFNLLRLDFGMDSIVGYMKVDSFYYVVMIACFILTTANVLMFSASLLWQRTKNWLLKRKALRASELYVVVGDNKDNISILKSIRKQGKQGILFANPDAEMRDSLYIEHIPFVKFNCEQCDLIEFSRKIEKLFGRALKNGGFVKKNLNVIVNIGTDEKNLLLTQESDRLLNKQYGKPFSCLLSKNRPDEKKSAAKCKQYHSLLDVPVVAQSGFFSVYTYGELANKSVYSDLIESAKGHIHFLNRYELISLDFIKKYPFTHFMTKEQIDAGQGLIQDDWTLNVCFIGYGPTTKQIFLRMVSDAQFYTKKKEELAHKKINYHFFDCQKAYSDKCFNQTYNRYSHKFLKTEYRKGKYLPLPEYPAAEGLYDETLGQVRSWGENEHFHVVNINDYRFLEELNKVLTQGEKSYNYVIISFGEDLADIDLAKRIRDSLELSDGLRQTYLFAKVRNKDLSDSLMEADAKYPIIPFGCSSDVVFNLLDNINDPIKSMAKLKSFAYPRGLEDAKESWEQRYEKALEKWLSDDFETRESNYFCCLNLRLKLNLLGFDYARKDSKEPDATSAYHLAYFGTDNIDEVNQKRYWFEDPKYDRSIYTDSSVRTCLARQEHQRWNVYYISCGYVPLPKKEIHAKGGKDQKHLRHGCLTTFDALEDLRKETNGKGDDCYSKEKRKYDYKILDIADLILDDLGYKIIRK